VTDHFTTIFKQPDASKSRGKYLSRVFGIFSEEIVRIWASDPRAPYEDLGRPTLRLAGEISGSTLDFALRSRETGKVYVSEMKCEIEYQNYKYLVLANAGQLNHHSKPAFAAFLAVARKAETWRAYIAKRDVKIDGAILIWGAATEEGRAEAMRDKGFTEVLTLAEIIADLNSWNNGNYRSLLEQRRTWSNEMYDALSSAKHTDA
jgi:hypothetical protein